VGSAAFSTALLREPSNDEESGESEEGNSAAERHLGNALALKVEETSAVGTDAANLLPLLVAGDGRVLGTVDELGQGDVSVVAEDMDLFEGLGGSVLELNAEEVTEIGGRATAELNDEGGSKVGDGLQLGVLLDDTGLVEEGDEWLIGGLGQEELEGIAVEGDALQSGDDRVHEGATRDVANASHVAIGEDAILVEVSKSASLFVESGWEAVGVGLVVGQLGVDEIVNVPGIFEDGRTAKDVILDIFEEGFGSPSLVLELRGGVKVLDMLLKVGAVGPGFEGTIIARLNGFDRNVLVATEGSSDNSLVSQSDFVVGIGGEKPLEDGDGRIEDDGAFGPGLHPDLDLAIVYDIRTDTWDVGRRGAVEVGRPEESTELVRLDLTESSGLGLRTRICIRVLVVTTTVTIASDDDNTEDFRQ